MYMFIHVNLHVFSSDMPMSSVYDTGTPPCIVTHSLQFSLLSGEFSAFSKAGAKHYICTIRPVSSHYEPITAGWN